MGLLADRQRHDGHAPGAVPPTPQSPRLRPQPADVPDLGTHLGELVQDCETRLRFYGQQLEYQSSTEHAMDYLVRNHGDAVAELVADGTIPTARRDGQPPAAYETKSDQADGASVS